MSISPDVSVFQKHSDLISEDSDKDFVNKRLKVSKCEKKILNTSK